MALKRVLAVDHGMKKIGLAASDPSGTIASPLKVIPHASRMVDAIRVAREAAACDARLIVVGQSLDEEGNPTPQGTRSARFAQALREQTCLPVVLWDEAFTTKDARAARIAMGARRKQRGGHLDQLAAAILLQSYLDSGTEP